MHDPKAFNNPMEYQPERYLKDGKLNHDVMGSDSVAFGFGRRSVDPKTFYDLGPAFYESLPKDLSRKTFKRQLIILNCILSSRSL